MPARILFLTQSAQLVRAQLAGAALTRAQAGALRDDISTDEITPAHICFFFDETLGEFPYTGLKAGNELPIKRGDVKQGGFVAAVSGKRRGKGSSREQSPYAERSAGIQLVIAENIERIYKQNCQNLGVLTSTNFSLIDKIRAGEEIPLSEFCQGEDEITRQVIEHGGLFPFNIARLQKKVSLPPIRTARRAMTLAEKIFARQRDR
jgi:3-isopropylmalate/(R)-2-methylmalate dehydratase large subunit